ncbi:hypothetical protein ACFFWD_08190 [Bradyrhizobium erythrophlei]|uniref:hypothetical protein n=1 Tax=Bradyrhizobium erythrophlei TaxID=1437360 RepID=UPI0035E4D814
MRAALIIALLAILAAVGIYAYEGLTLPGATMPEYGYAALGIGVVFAIIVGAGLMGLLFYSSRHGYDEPPRYERERDLLIRHPRATASPLRGHVLRTY